MYFNRTRVMVVVTLFAGVSAFACSSAPPDSTLASDINGNNTSSSGNNAVPKKTTGTNTGSSSGTPAPNPTTPTPAPTVAPDGGVPVPAPVGNGQCAATPDLNSCIDCCDPGGNALVIDDQAWEQCVCTSACATQCGNNWCAGGPATAACAQCLQADTVCGQQADAQCNADAACAAALACVQSSNCDAKQ